VRIQGSSSDVFDVTLNRDSFALQIKTRSRGLLTGLYDEHNELWLPIKMEQSTDESILRLDGFEYSFDYLNGRPRISSVWLSADQNQPRRQSQLMFVECKN
jgi:hypothetical protein